MGRQPQSPRPGMSQDQNARTGCPGAPEVNSLEKQPRGHRGRDGERQSLRLTQGRVTRLNADTQVPDDKGRHGTQALPPDSARTVSLQDALRVKGQTAANPLQLPVSKMHYHSDAQSPHWRKSVPTTLDSNLILTVSCRIGGYKRQQRDSGSKE